MVAGWLWWLAVPFAAALVLRFLSFAPGVKPLLNHHAERWLVVVRHPGRRDRGGRRGDGNRHHAPGQPRPGRRLGRRAGRRVGPQRDRPGRGRPADLRGVRGPDHRPHPRARALPGRRRVLRQHRMRDRGRTRRGRPGSGCRRRSWPCGGCRWSSCGPGPVLSVSLSLAERPIGQPSFLERLVLAPERARPETLEVVGHLPDGATWPISERALMPWVRRRRVRRVAAFTLLIAGLLNVVFALLWPVQLDPSGRGLAALRHPSRQRRHRRDRRPGSGRSGTRGAARLPAGMAGGSRPPAGEHRLPPGAGTWGLEGSSHRLPVRPVAAARAPPLPGQPVGPPPGPGLGDHDRPGSGRPGRRAGRRLPQRPARPAMSSWPPSWAP